MFENLYYDLKSKYYDRKVKKSGKEQEKWPVYCSTKKKFLKALDDKKEYIVVTGEAYSEILEHAKQSQSSKTVKGAGVGAILLGAFILPGLSAWIATGAGAIAYVKGNQDDVLKRYKIDIDEMKKEIRLKLKK